MEVNNYETFIKLIDIYNSNTNNIEIELAQIKKQYDLAHSEKEECKQQHLEISSKANILQKIVDSNQGLSDGTLALREKLSNLIIINQI
jgi:hypothetical protein